MKMLVQICCSVDSHYFLTRLKQEFANDEIIGFFYNPNIHPQSEFELRFCDVARSCKQLGIELVKGEYTPLDWLGGTKGLETEPEKGKRCEYCFDYRMAHSAKMAQKLGCARLTTTLLMSPKKSINQLGAALLKAADECGLEAVVVDYRKNGGTNEQMRMAFEAKLYHQNYCGCIHALYNENAQKAAKNLSKSNLVLTNSLAAASGVANPPFDARLFNPLSRQIQPNSPEQRLEVFSKVARLQEQGADFELQRRKTLNYRLLRAFVRFEAQVLPSYVLFYSTTSREVVKFSLSEEQLNAKSAQNGVVRLQKEGLVLLHSAAFEKLLNRVSNSVLTSRVKNAQDFCHSPPPLEHENAVRSALCGEFSLNAIVVLDELKAGKYELFLQSQIFEDYILHIGGIDE